MPTLTVEDGTGVANANTYIDITFLEAYATDRGFTIPSEDVDKEIFILKAMDYLAWYTNYFQGQPTEDDQALPWPRKNVCIDSVDVDKESIPVQLTKAQAQLVVSQQESIRLFPQPRTSSVQGLLTQKTLGPLTKKYAFTGDGLASASAPITIMPVHVFLKPLFKNLNPSLATFRA